MFLNFIKQQENMIKYQSIQHFYLKTKALECNTMIYP